MNIIEAKRDANLFRPLFRDPDTWASWDVFLKALFGLPMEEPELELFRQTTGREAAPERPFGEAWVVAGRRSGKSFMAALIASYLACFKDYRSHLAPGERAVILIVAADRVQAQICFRYIRGFLNETPMLARMVEAERAETIDLITRVSLSVATCSYRSIRGFTAACVIADEISFWRDENSSNPAEEVLRAVRPALATIPGSLLLCISSPYAQSGPLWEAFRRHFGQESDTLVWRADTLTMNPTISRELIDKAATEDPEAARSEWGAEFRTDLESFLPVEAIEAVTVPGRYELPPQARTIYTAFADVSGGRLDAAALGIAHREGELVILDAARRWPAPHNPQAVIEEMAEVLAAYKVRRVVGDKYAGAWPEKEFLEHGIAYEASAKDKSALYLEFLPQVMGAQVELLDNQTLFHELRSLERRVRVAGRDLVSHPPRGSDDLVNAVAGVCVTCERHGSGFFAGCDLS